VCILTMMRIDAPKNKTQTGYIFLVNTEKVIKTKLCLILNCVYIVINKNFSINLCANMMRNFPRQEIRNHDSPKITHHGYRCTKKINPVWGIFYFYFISRLGYKFFLLLKIYPKWGIYFFLYKI
jgi:hypothetical protein